jgi:hypothetical protein
MQTKELDVVELVVGVGRWPAGTIATVVEIFPSAVLAEIADARGHSEDFVALPHALVRTVETHAEEDGET